VQPDISGDLLASLGADGFGGAHDPRLITALAGRDGWIDSLDILMAARGTGRQGSPPVLVSRPDLSSHPRAAFAAGIRVNPRIMGYPDPGRCALITVSAGVAGLAELSFELEPGHRGQGSGAKLARDALRVIPSGELALAAVAPGNAASLRALLAASFVPLGSLQLFRRAGHDPEGAGLPPGFHENCPGPSGCGVELASGALPDQDDRGKADQPLQGPADEGQSADEGHGAYEGPRASYASW
jgi:hypothetical protein